MNRNIILRSVLLVAAVVLGVRSAHAEDIDLFVGSIPATAGNLPNVLFVIDNTANWNGAFAHEMAALSSTFENLATGPGGAAKFNIGVMFSVETGSGNNNIDGGYVRAAMRPMNTANKAIYARMIADLDRLRDTGNGGDSSLVMAEAYRYFSAGTTLPTAGIPYAGNNKAKTDFTGNTGADWSPSVTDPESLAAMRAVYALPGNALASKGATRYNSPTSAGCAKNFIIYISNGAAQDSNSTTTKSNQLLADAGGNNTQINLSPSGSADNVSDEWARFMKNSPLAVTTFTIDIDRVTTGQGPGWTRVLRSMAEESEGTYYSADSTVNGGDEITVAVGDALAKILSVNTVFASVSLPVSVNTQGAYLNQVFIGMFRPDGVAKPRWTGNLKQYRIGTDPDDSTSLRLEDSVGKSAISNETGFIQECARSFWTPATPDTYWSFVLPEDKKDFGSCPVPTGQGQYYYKDSNSPDGSIVEKGGQAYVLRQSTTRNVKTCSKTFAGCTTLTNFEAANTDITEAALGVASATDRTSLIEWATGLDVLNEDGDLVTTAEMRPSVHGDVVHSRPVALDFSTGAPPAPPKVVVFYGGNDGVFRAINGNRTANIGTAVPGKELWSFVAPESFSLLKRLKDNAPRISFPNVPEADARPKDYGLDGPVTAHQFAGGAWIYGTMRRGGRAMYAFNVPAADPANITLKWKLGCPNNLVPGAAANDTDCASGFSGIGQTWSSPKVLRAAGFGSGSAPLLMMGGGYDLCEDADPNTCSSSSKGRQVYVLNADTGALEKSFTTTRPVVADVAIAPDLDTGLAKYAYVVDTGGDVYRITIGTAAPSAWTMTKIASLGCASTSACTVTGNRKFLFPPDLVEEDGGYSLLIGSGDREKPLRYGSGVSNAVANYFFKIQDKPLDSAWLTSETANCGSAIMCLQSLLPITGDATPTAADLDTKKGFYLGLNTTEQVVTSAITIFGTVTFSTYEPSTPSVSSCSNDLGIARVYNIALSDASSQNDTDDRFEELPPIGLPPSPTAGVVLLDDGTTRAYCIGCSGTSPLQADEPVIPLALSPLIPKSRVYWYVEQ